MLGVPTCGSSEDMARLAGAVVRLVGVYRKKMEVLSMPRPGRPAPEPRFRGYVVIELAGSPDRYDPTKSPGDPTLVQLGRAPRPAAEVDRWLGKTVEVQGRLLLDADILLSGAELEQARPASLPVLVGPEAVAERL